MAPGHRDVSRWYEQLARQLEAGLPLAEAMETASGKMSPQARRMAARLRRGASWEEAAAQGPAWLRQTDGPPLAAAMQTARLPETLRRLSAWHEQAAMRAFKALLAALYPLFLLHCGILLLPVTGAAEFTAGGRFIFHFQLYAARVLAWLIPLWGLLALFYLTGKIKPSVPRQIARFLPFWRGYAKAKSLADFVFLLEAFYAAGASPELGWKTAGRACGDPALAKASEAIGADAARGHSPAGALPAHACFPKDFAAECRAGERTGQMDVCLARLSARYQDQAGGKLAAASVFYLGLFFAAILIYAVSQVFLLYRGYLDAILNFMQG